MSDVYYARGRIIKAADQLVTTSAPIKQRAWDTYHTLVDGGVHEGMESEYEELKSIFNGIR
jgi:hypothetical protein